MGLASLRMLPGLSRFIGETGQVPRWLDDLLYNGDLPQPAELLAQRIYIAGSAANLPASPAYPGLFDDGSPHMPTLVDSGAPNDIYSVADLAKMDSRAYTLAKDSQGNDIRPKVQVTAVGEPPRFVVAIPGTTLPLPDLQGWDGHEAGTDWPANFKGIGYGDSSVTQSTKAAIDAAISQWEADNNTRLDRPEVLLTGHSQGGIIAANIASDPFFTHRYKVGGVVTFGSPVNTIPVDATVPVTNFRRNLDIVPHLDLDGKPQANLTEISLGGGGESPWDAHDAKRYFDSIQQQASSPQIVAVDKQISRFFGSGTIYTYEIGRD